MEELLLLGLIVFGSLALFIAFGGWIGFIAWILLAILLSNIQW